MWNLQDDNELDKLSREAAEHYPMDRSPESWNKLHQRLEAEMPAERRRRYLLFLLLFLFVGSGAFWLSRIGSDDSTKPDIAATVEATKQEAGIPGTKESVVPNDKSSIPRSAPQQNAATANESQPESSGSTTVPIAATERRVTNNAGTPNKILNSRTRPQATGRKDLRSRGVVENQNGIDKRKTDAKTKVETTVAADAGADQVTHAPIDNNKGKSIDETVADKKDDAEKVAASSVDEKKESSVSVDAPKGASPKSKQNSRWTFGAVYAPDMSSVKFTHSQPLGFNVGVTAEYRLSKKFSLQSGLIYTKKNYKMYGEDYHPPKGTWIDYVNLEDVTGDCMMFDIPVNFRFNAVRKKSSNIFMSAGLSTYLMKEENYSYFYYYNTTPTTRDRSYDANSEYLFSILNLSVGYEKKLTNAFSLQVEPFFKQPLTGLGFGEINLNSTGVYFSLRYNPLHATKQQAAKK